MQESAARRRRTQPEHDVARPRTFTRERELSVAATTPDWLLPDQESPAPRGPSRAATAWAEGRTPLRAAPNPNRRTVTITGQTVDDALFARLKQHYSEKQIVELTAAIALENFRSKFNPALGIEAQGFCMITPR